MSIYTHRIFFIQSPTDAYLHWFHNLAIMNNVMIICDMKGLLWLVDLQSFGYIPRSIWLGHTVVLPSVFLRTLYSDFHTGWICSHPPAVYKGHLYAVSQYALLIVLFMVNILSRRSRHFNGVLNFLIAKDAENSFYIFTGHLYFTKTMCSFP